MAVRVIQPDEDAGLEEGAGADLKRITSALRRPFPTHMVGFRLGRKMSKEGTRYLVFPYVAAPAVRARFDAVAPGAASWVFRPGPFADTLECSITLHGQSRTDAAVLKPPRNNEDGPETRVKGAYSDAFKRTGAAWGVGDYLKAMPQLHVDMGADAKTYLNREQIAYFQRTYETWVHSDHVVSQFGSVLDKDGPVATGDMPVDEDIDGLPDAEALAQRSALGIEAAMSMEDLSRVREEIAAVARTLPPEAVVELRARYKARKADLEQGQPDGDIPGGATMTAPSPTHPVSSPVAVPASGSVGPPVSPVVIFAERPCPDCQTGTLRVRKGRNGDFIGCSNYPDCRHTEPGGEKKVGASTFRLASADADLPAPVAPAAEPEGQDPEHAHEQAPAAIEPEARAALAEPDGTDLQARAMWVAERLMRFDQPATIDQLIEEALRLADDHEVAKPNQFLLKQLATTRREERQGGVPEAESGGELPLDGPESKPSRQAQGRRRAATRP